MIRKTENPAGRGPLKEASRGQAAAENPARDRIGRMRRPSILNPGAGKAGGAPEASRAEKNLEALGNLLKTKREINGLTRRDIVVKIKIPLDQLEAIEEGRLSSLPPVFAKGFLRAYANELGLDAESMLDDYRKMTGGFKNEPASREPLAPRYVESSVGSVGWRPGPRFIVFVVLLIAAMAAAFIWWPELRSTAGGWLPGGGSPAVETPAGGGSATQDGSTGGIDGTQSAGAEDGSSTIGGFIGQPPADGDTGRASDIGSLESGGAGTAGSAKPLPVLTTPTSLTLTSTKDQAWAEVTVDGGSPEYFWFARAGQSAKVIATESIIVSSGAAKDLLVLWDGQEELGPLSATTATTVKVRFPDHYLEFLNRSRGVQP